MKLHKYKKELIIKTAFEEWGKNFYRHTGISMITDKLDMTKPAFYRYFKSKDELLETMNEQLIEELSHISKSFQLECEKLPLHEMIHLYIKKVFGFFARNQFYFIYFILNIKKLNLSSYQQMLTIFNQKAEILAERLHKTEHGLNPDEILSCSRFIDAVGIFILIHTLNPKRYESKKKDMHELKATLSDETIEIMLNKIFRIVMHGVSHHPHIQPINFDQIELQCLIHTCDLSQRDKIFSSIASVVAAEGLWNATLDKVAQKIGIAKSSLYFYFKNKNEMIVNMILNEFNRLDTLISDRIKNYTRAEEQLYVLIVVTASYLLIDQDIMHIFDWLHFQGYDLKKIMKNRIFTSNFFILEGIKKQELFSTEYLEPDFIIGFINMLIIKDILMAQLDNKKLTVQDMRQIYHLLLYGITKEKNNEYDVEC